MKRFVAKTVSGFRSLVVFLLQLAIKYGSKLFYRYEVSWLGDSAVRNFKDLRCFILLNHTSLYEFLLLGGSPGNKLLWHMARRGVVPVADITYKKAHGWIYRFLVKRTQSISRKRDDSWDSYLEMDSVRNPMFMLAPEGRMKRPNGLDKHGQAMSLRGGIADVLAKIDTGRMLVLYSGGLHHVAPPGCKGPKVFKTIRFRLESFSIQELKQACDFREDATRFKDNLIAYLEERQREICSQLELPNQELARGV